MALLLCGIAHHSDSGLYYCCVQKEKYLSFSSTTYLQIRVKNIISEAGCTYNVLSMLVFGGVIVVLLSGLLFLLFIIQKYRKHHRADFNSTLKNVNEEQDGEIRNYAPLHFSIKKNNRSHRRVGAEYTHILYCSVRQ
ncbi:hypothetical protein NFI96_022246 [Prochilodus magdalenae]|nr:hypothetical protein NFI96_022246 [Prochilodus magdalenae]